MATPPERARTNRAATQCDDTGFRGRGVRLHLTRDFVFPAVQDAREFGLTQTVGRMRNQRLARGFVQGVRDRVANCASDGFGTEVSRLVDQSGPRAELTIWQIDVELSDTATLRYLMAIMRQRETVAQVGFVPSRRMSMSRDDFTWVARRALERLPRLRLEDAKG